MKTQNEKIESASDLAYLVKRLRTFKHRDASAAASALEAMASEAAKWKQQYFTASAQAIREAEKAESAEAERDRLKTAAVKILAKLDHPTASVTQWDVDELRAAIEGQRPAPAIYPTPPRDPDPIRPEDLCKHGALHCNQCGW